MENKEEDIVIVGAGIAGLTTALGLHRLGLRSLVLESSDSLRVTGFALTLWTNAWRAMDAVGIGNSLRQHYPQIPGFRLFSSVSGVTSDISPDVEGKDKGYESRCVLRKELLETLGGELPHGTIRYSSKVVSIENSGYHKLLHLADDSTLKTKVLIGCDGVNSVVAKWLGLQNPVDSGRSGIRGFVEFPDGHGFQPRFHWYFGGGVRYGFLPCDDKCMNWFCTFKSSVQHDDGMGQNPAKMKQFVLSKISKVPQKSASVVEMTELDSISCSPLKLRLPWNLVLGNISKGNVCVAGDALHPMTPDIGQGGCAALEDSVVLARCIAEALLRKPRKEEIANEEKISKGEEEHERIKKGLEKFAKERRRRSFRLVSAGYLVGLLQESDWKVMRPKDSPCLSILIHSFLEDDTAIGGELSDYESDSKRDLSMPDPMDVIEELVNQSVTIKADSIGNSLSTHVSNAMATFKFSFVKPNKSVLYLSAAVTSSNRQTRPGGLLETGISGSGDCGGGDGCDERGRRVQVVEKGM
ncbi:hypothetical protein Vadar_029168 [Vaccinium darrowii]|uniref:Uncharacterized protein n=1 Tax=Vaccinium darrowii TaxID=229202 RepID=A0ACB7Y9F7_9ERIC|nr:hypothetical protein Vadar_029168 [Vaccinium darrowii]